MTMLDCADTILPPSESDIEEERARRNKRCTFERLSRCDLVEREIDFLHDDPEQMTFARRIAMHLTRYPWYNPLLKGHDSADCADNYIEMNNGRILTILDLGRTGLAQRVGILSALARNRWGLTVAGNSVMYRKRIRPFVKFRVVSKCVGWDDKFMYLEQSLWIGADCAVQALFRTAVTDKNGIVRPEGLMADMGLTTPSPELPDWVKNWIDADKTRPWPPTDNGET